MKQQALILITLSIILFQASACDREANAIVDAAGPDITFFSPKPGDEVVADEPVWLHVRFSEELELHEVKITLQSEEHPNLGIIYVGHAHEKELDVEKEILLPNIPGTLFEFLAEASDHEGNISTSTVSIFMK